jgi:hypothetical protein
MKVRSSVACAVLSVVLSSCGGGGGLTPGVSRSNSTCQTAPACGGDVVGSWSIASTCLTVDVSSFTADCPSASAFANGYQIAGMITYDANMTFTLMSTLTGSVVARYPARCLTPPDGVAVTCDTLGPALLAGGKYASVDCLPDADGCDCTFGMTPQTFTGTGTYSIAAGNVLTAGVADESDYCVKGDGTAVLATHPASPIMGHFGLTSGSLTLTKQP